MGNRFVYFVFFSCHPSWVSDPRILWYTLKGCITNITISFASHLNKVRLCKTHELESKLKELENQQQLSFCETRKQNIQVTRTEFDSLLRHRAEFLIHKTRRHYYFNGPRPSHLLAQRLKHDEKFSTISAIKSSHSQNIINEPKEINNEFRNFNSKLYSSELTLDTERCLSSFTKPKPSYP